jgi:acetyl-CoA carboxylase biotin carboxyl carrier protein
MDVNPLTNDDVADILALLDSLPYDELDLETPRFRLTLRRTPGGWTQSTQVAAPPGTGSMAHWSGSSRPNGTSTHLNSGRDEAEAAGEAEEAGGTDGNVEGTRREADAARGETGGAHGEAGETEGDDGHEDAGLVAVRAPLPGTFYRAPRPGAAPFVEVGSQVDADTVIGIVETMKLMNSVPAGVAGVVAEFCVANAEFAAQGAALLRIRADR